MQASGQPHKRQGSKVFLASGCHQPMVFLYKRMVLQALNDNTKLLLVWVLLPTVGGMA